MRMFAWILALSSGLAVFGCKTQEPVPRGHFYLPEDSFMTLKRVEGLVPAGMPIEQAREVMETHGFVCTYEEAVGVPYLQCNQIRRRSLWPFNGTWMATIYFQEGVVTAVQARYDINPVEVGTKVPKRASRQAREIDRAKDAQLMNAAHAGPELPMAVEVMPGPVATPQVPTLPSPPSPSAGVPVESSAPATVPVEIP